jgi:hypothetical protein
VPERLDASSLEVTAAFDTGPLAGIVETSATVRVEGKGP